jgi:hypothetical protein
LEALLWTGNHPRNTFIRSATSFACRSDNVGSRNLFQALIAHGEITATLRHRAAILLPRKAFSEPRNMAETAAFRRPRRLKTRETAQI